METEVKDFAALEKTKRHVLKRKVSNEMFQTEKAKRLCVSALAIALVGIVAVTFQGNVDATQQTTGVIVPAATFSYNTIAAGIPIPVAMVPAGFPVSGVGGFTQTNDLFGIFGDAAYAVTDVSVKVRGSMAPGDFVRVEFMQGGITFVTLNVQGDSASDTWASTTGWLRMAPMDPGDLTVLVTPTNPSCSYVIDVGINGFELP